MNDETIARELAIQDDEQSEGSMTLNDKAPVQELACSNETRAAFKSHEECSWARSFLGCVNRTQKASPCVHGKPGCLGTAHHNCAAEWEFAFYKVENPDGAPGDCPYDSHGKKYCIDCHPHSVRALSVPDEAEEDYIIGEEDGDDKADGEEDDNDGANIYVCSICNDMI